MGSNTEMTRKEFLTLTFTLVTSTAAIGACSSDNNAAGTGTGGSTGHGGTTGAGGNGGAAGTSAGGGAGTSAGGTTGTGGGAAGAAACSDPLPETMVPDSTGHSHSVMIAASKLSATTAQTFDTSVAEPGTAGAHMHMVTLEPSQLAMLKGGTSVTVMSSIVMSHGHMFTVSCH
jgi:hypothetical protein